VIVSLSSLEKRGTLRKRKMPYSFEGKKAFSYFQVHRGGGKRERKKGKERMSGKK